ncbi:MAG: DUF58 domain-containing protein, partial [Candidatus Aenigmarchaeota archaeon]|nr:DUF58 domain-containing protein [Candidatus Aenigmarchaeota archaeon]
KNQVFDMPKAKQVLKKVRKLDIKTKKLVDGLMQGAYISAFKGRGIEFCDVREYVPGDDIRSIDWNVTARTDEPHVKEFIEERDLTAIIVFDASASSDFGTQKSLKKEQGIEIAASIAMSAVKNNDKIGLLIATEGVEKFIAPKKGLKYAFRIIRELIYCQLKHKTTNIKTALEFLINITKRKSIIFIISDFQFNLKDIEKPLSILNRKNDVVCIKLDDLRDYDIPDVVMVEFEDEETGECVLIDTKDPIFRENYKKMADEKQKNTNDFFMKKRIDIINISTSKEWAHNLHNFFKQRRKKFR